MSLLVVRSGAQTLVQDAGRLAYAAIGVPEAGPFDRRAWRLANRLVGNRETSAVLECLGGGLALQAERHLTLAVTGADGSLTAGRRTFPTNQPVHASPGELLTLHAPIAGLRYYLAVSGGFTLRPVLGSQARDTLGGLGPVVRDGDALPVGPSQGHPVVDHVPARPRTATFFVTPGPDLDVRPLLNSPWDLDPQSNRIGVRLTGIPLRTAAVSLPSRPMVRGAVQVPPNGLPIILGPDHPTTGGYPVIAVVTAESMDDVAQWSGGPRRFRLAR